MQMEWWQRTEGESHDSSSMNIYKQVREDGYWKDNIIGQKAKGVRTRMGWFGEKIYSEFLKQFGDRIEGGEKYI